MSRKPRSVKDLKRQPAKFAPYDRILIVCEGSKSEPNYFDALIKELKLNTANVVVDGDSDSSPRSVVAHAKKVYQKDKKINGDEQAFDKVYCVFDTDEHPTYAEASNTLKSAQPQNVFEAITSNPCFEFWILLHFEYTTRPIARQGERSPCDVTVGFVKKHLPDYKKGEKSIYQQIRNHTNTAIEHAKRVKLTVDNDETDNPHTLVHELVEKLRNLSESLLIKIVG